MGNTWDHTFIAFMLLIQRELLTYIVME